MRRSLVTGLVFFSLFGCAFSAWSADQPTDTRFYVAPMASYGLFNEDTFNPDNNVGAQLSVGKTLTKYLAFELYAFNFNNVDIQSNGHHPNGNGNIDITGYGGSALLFPARDIFPIFAVVGVGAGIHDFDQVVGYNNTGDINRQHSHFFDVGAGFLYPLNFYGIAIRGEYRFRHSRVDAEVPGSYDFRDNIFSLGVQIPLGPKPQPKPAVQKAAPPPPPAAPPKPKDSDGDGVPDSRDRCPGTPAGTAVNEFGCPQAKKAPVVLKGVTFEFDSAKLTAQAENRLDNVVNALQAAGEINVQVAGNTDSIGSAAYNLKLSQRRADSVKAYLVTHGIDPDRLTTVGYGETRPVAPNTKPDGSDNPAGRAKNRRVELHVTNQ